MLKPESLIGGRETKTKRTRTEDRMREGGWGSSREGIEEKRMKIVRVNLCMDRWIFLKHFLFHWGISIAF